MRSRTLRRSAAIAVASTLAFAGVAAADTLRADGDVVAPDVQNVVYLGAVAPSSEVVAHVGFALKCSSTSHVDPGQTVTLDLESSSHFGDGDVLSVSQATLGPVPADWTVDGDFCPFPAPVLAGGTTSEVHLKAPSGVGVGFSYTLFYSRRLSPGGVDDDNTWGFSSTAVTFLLDVVSNTAPILHLPSDMTVEGDTTGGWTAAFSATATDAEDAPAPTPSCQPAVGDVIPLGTTTVNCSVIDSGGMKAAGSFDVTVTDTTAPTLSGMPGDQAVNTGDPSGARLTYATPHATDIVDASPSVRCSPTSGWLFPVGTTAVTCTATDRSGNSTSKSFDVVDRYVAPHAATALWGEPVTSPGDVFTANPGRTIPVKVRLFVDGVEAMTGAARLTLTPCGGTAAEWSGALTRGGGRWNASIDTSDFAGACYTVRASIDGLVAGSFRLDLRGATATAKVRPH